MTQPESFLNLNTKALEENRILRVENAASSREVTWGEGEFRVSGEHCCLRKKGSTGGAVHSKSVGGKLELW